MTKRMLLVFGFAFTLTSNSVFAAKAPTLIVLFGDSITSGYYNPNSPGSIPDCNADVVAGVISSPDNCPRLDLNVQMAGPPERPVILSNWSDGGTTSSFGVSHISDNLVDNSILYSANGCELGGGGDTCYVLIMYGTNDEHGGISSTTTGFNISVMIDRAKDKGYTPIIGTLTPRSDNSVSPYNSEIKNAANDKGVAIVDHYARFISQSGGWQTLIDLETSSNGQITDLRLHPNDMGYKVIAQTWFDEQLKDLIKPNLVIAPVIYLLMDD